jgi:hypothetical protein
MRTNLFEIIEEQKELSSVISRERGMLRDVEGTYPNVALAYSAFALSVKRAEHFIHMMGSSLTSVVRDRELPDELTKALNRGVQIRVVLMDPESPRAKHLEALDRDGETFDRTGLQRWLEWSEKLPPSLRENLEMQLSPNPILLTLLLTEDDGLFVPALPTRSQLDVLVFRVVAKGKGSHRFLRTLFEDYWYQSRPVQLARSQ